MSPMPSPHDRRDRTSGSWSSRHPLRVSPSLFLWLTAAVIVVRVLGWSAASADPPPVTGSVFVDSTYLGGSFDPGLGGALDAHDGVGHGQNSALLGTTRVRDFVRFPAYVRVPNHHVCLDDGTLRAHIPAITVQVCDESYVDYSDSKYPRMVCNKSHVETVPAQELATPATYTTTVCLNEFVDYSDSQYPRRTCREWGPVARTYLREYRVEAFKAWDYRKEAGQYEFRRLRTPPYRQELMAEQISSCTIH